MSPSDRLTELIDDFISGRNRSRELVADAEALLIADFSDTDIFEILAQPIALYRPGSGSPYTAEADMLEIFSEVRKELLSQEREAGQRRPLL